MPKALIVGSDGYLGKHLEHFLALRNFDVFKSGRRINKFENYTKVDVVNSDEVKKLDFKVDYIFLCFGLNGVISSFKNGKEFIEVNEIGLINVLNHYIISESKARIIYFSSRLVYKGKETLLRESDEKEPKSIYAQNKLSSERYIEYYSKLFDVNYTIFRLSVPYANVLDDNYPYGTINHFLQKSKAGDDIILFGDGKVVRTFTHIADICKQVLRSITINESNRNIYNIGGENFSLIEVAELFADKFGNKIKFIDWPEEYLQVESGSTILDSSKLYLITNREYKHKLIDWLKEV